MGHFLVRHALLIKCELRMAVYKPTRPVSFSAGLEVRNSLFTTKTCFTILFLFFFFSFFFFTAVKTYPYCFALWIRYCEAVSFR